MRKFNATAFLFTTFCCIMLLALSSCNKDSNTPEGNELDITLEEKLNAAANGKGKSFFVLPNSNDFSNIPQDSKNPLTAEKVELGKFLFHETGLAYASKMPLSYNCYSCASCHHAKAGFQAGIAQGIAEGGIGFGVSGEGRIRNPFYVEDSMLDVQPLRSPSAMNGAFQTNQLWNGQFGATHLNEGTEYAWTVGTPKENNALGYQGLETQAIAGQKVHRLKVDELVKFIDYQYLFNKAYPTLPNNEKITRITAGMAIAAYERTLLSNEAPFQLWLKGQTNALTEEEKKGAILFFGKGQCASCHTGPALNSMSFYALGMNDLLTGNYGVFSSDPTKPDHKGRGGFTGKAEDMYKFKVPQLYNLVDSKFYGHGSSFTSVREVIAYKNKAIKQNANVQEGQLSPQFRPLSLTEEEIDQIKVFIENGLRDPNLVRYVPSYLPSKNCFPNNDPQAKTDMGCH